MKVNKHTAIVGENVVLVPYREEHVQKYHQWMSDAEIRELTASEPLTLEEEYDMQRKWQDDEDKLTFIILVRSSAHSSFNARSNPASPSEINSYQMIGDVNLFLKGSLDDENLEAEVEIMIAEPLYRRQGLALCSLQLFLSYITSYSPSSPPPLPSYNPPLPIDPSHFIVRISESNTPSINMFTKLGFAITKHVAVFGEVEMRLKLGEGDGAVRWGEQVSAKTWAKGVVIDYP